MKKTRLALCILCSLCLLLGGCSSMTFESMDSAPAVALPTPDVSAMTAPVGDSRSLYSIRATLYYRTADGQLSAALRLINTDPDDDELSLILESLLETPYSSSGLLPIAPEGTRLLSVSLLGGIATVDLSAQALSGGEEAFYIARAAIAKTLLGRDGVDAVNVLVEGRAVQVTYIPLGALTQQDSDASGAFMQHFSERMLFENDGYVERCAVLYLPDADSGLLLPTVAGVRFHSSDFLSPVLEAFRRAVKGGGHSDEQLSALSANLSLNSAGERVLTVELPADIEGAQDLLAPALACTLCSFLPDIDAVRIFVGSEQLSHSGTAYANENILFSPDDLRAMAGTNARLYFTTDSFSLVGCDHVLPGRSPGARALLAELMRGPLDSDPASAMPIFPEGVDQTDILGVRIEDGVAHVNLSASLYSACQSCTPEQERALVYAMVNTLVANLGTVSRVQFYIDSSVAETFAGAISILTPLMANPGLS